MEKNYDLRQQFYLIDQCDNQIITNKLPTNLQVLRVFFYNHSVVKLEIRESASLAVREANLFWEKARLPTRDNQHCIKKLEDLYKTWKLLQKNRKRRTTTQINKELEFKKSFSMLFDIAHANVLSLKYVLDEDKQFLILQREGLTGYMIAEMPEKSTSNAEVKNSSVDETLESQSQVLDTNDISTFITSNSTLNSQLMSGQVLDTNDISTSITSNSTLNSQSGSEYAVPRGHQCLMEQSNPPEENLSKRKKIMTTKLASALDVAKVSDRQAVHILFATCEALDVDVNNVTLSRSSVHRFREDSRAEYAKKIQEKYKNIKDEIFTVHWDGKLLPALTSNERVDRLPVIITSKDTEILLGIPYLDCGTGIQEAEAIYECLSEWGIEGNIEAVCCDTEAVNTGPRNGACVLLEQKLNKSLLHFLCRHHIAEVILKAVFEIKFGGTSGPGVPFFKKFQDAWNDLNKTNFQPGINDPEILKALKNKISSTLAFSLELLEESHFREDYRELLELTTIFLGVSPKRGIFLRRPGAMHQARWMAKAIYCLKMFLLREEYSMDPEDEKSCKEVCIFIVSIYVTYWFNAANAEKAPNQDLLLIKELQKYSKIDSAISEAALKKIQNHLWYLTPEVAALAFFDEDLSFQEKNKMIKALTKKNKSSNDIKRLPATSVKDIRSKNVNQFINEDSMNFFLRFKMQTSFLEEHPSLWHQNDDYNACKKIVNSLKVINDIAERNVKLISDFNKLITRDEDQKQYLIKVVTEYRKQFPNCNKNILSEKMT